MIFFISLLILICRDELEGKRCNQLSIILIYYITVNNSEQVTCYSYTFVIPRLYRIILIYSSSYSNKTQHNSQIFTKAIFPSSTLLSASESSLPGRPPFERTIQSSHYTSPVVSRTYSLFFTISSFNCFQMSGRASAMSAAFCVFISRVISNRDHCAALAFISTYSRFLFVPYTLPTHTLLLRWIQHSFLFRITSLLISYLHSPGSDLQ